MEKTIKIIFVRHGESEKDVLHIHSCGLDNFPLTEKGREEVKKIADKINDKIDIIISSPILRARETAKIINKKVKQKIIIEKEISEYDWGIWNDVLKNELLNDFSDYKDYKKLDPQKRFNYRLGKIGESRAEVVKRVKKFIKKLVKNYLGETVLLVSHGGISAAIHKVLEDCSFDEYFKHEKLDHNTIQYFIVDGDLKLIKYQSKNY